MSHPTLNGSERRQLLLLAYIFFPAIAYPLIIMAVQDFPYLSQFDVKQYYRLSTLTHFRFEEYFIGCIFIVIYIFGFIFLFINRWKSRFYIITFVFSNIIYMLGTSVTGVYFGISPPSQLPPFLHGSLMFVATGLSTSILMRLLSSEAAGISQTGRGEETRSTTREMLKTTCFIGYLFVPIPLYPIVILFIVMGESISGIHVEQIYDSTGIPLYSYQMQLLALGFLTIYLFTFSVLFIRIYKMMFFGFVIIVSYALYNIGTYIKIAIDVFIPTANMQPSTCRAVDISNCLLAIEHGWILGLSTVLSTIIVERLFKYVAGRSVYDSV